MVKDIQALRKDIHHSATHCVAINSGLFEIKPMKGGSNLEGGEIILGIKEDYEENDEYKTAFGREEAKLSQIVVIFWKKGKKKFQATLPMMSVEALKCFINEMYVQNFHQLNLSRLIRFSSLIWSVMYHALV